MWEPRHQHWDAKCPNFKHSVGEINPMQSTSGLTAACHPRSPDYTHYLWTSTLSNQANWWFRMSELAVYKGIVPCQLESSEATFRRTQPLSPPPVCHSKSLEGQCGCKHSFEGIVTWTGYSEWRLGLVSSTLHGSLQSLVTSSWWDLMPSSGLCR